MHTEHYFLLPVSSEMMMGGSAILFYRLPTWGAFPKYPGSVRALGWCLPSDSLPRSPGQGISMFFHEVHWPCYRAGGLDEPLPYVGVLYAARHYVENVGKKGLDFNRVDWCRLCFTKPSSISPVNSLGKQILFTNAFDMWLLSGECEKGLGFVWGEWLGCKGLGLWLWGRVQMLGMYTLHTRSSCVMSSTGSWCPSHPFTFRTTNVSWWVSGVFLWNMGEVLQKIAESWACIRNGKGPKKMRRGWQHQFHTEPPYTMGNWRSIILWDPGIHNNRYLYSFSITALTN